MRFILKTIIAIIATVIIIIIITVAIKIMTTTAANVETIIPIVKSPSNSSQLTIDNDHDNTLEILCQVSPLSPLYKSVFTGRSLV